MLRDARLILILIIGSLTVMTGAVVAPNLPDLVRQLNLDPEIAGILVGTHFITVALSVPWFGILADRLGSLPVLIPSLIFYAAFGTGGAFMPDFQALLICRALLGVATGGLTAAGMGLLGKLYGGERRLQVLAYASGTLAIANILYPLLAGLLGFFGWRWAFGMYSLALPLAALSLALLRHASAPVRSPITPPSAIQTPATPPAATPEMTQAHNRDHQTPNSPPPSLLNALLNPHVFPVLCAMCVSSGTIYVAFVYVPIYMRDMLNAPTALIGLVLATTAIGSAIVAAFGVRRLAQVIGDLGSVALGYGIMAVSLVGFTLVTQISIMFAVAIVFGMSFGTIMPSLYGFLSDRTPNEFQATILSTGTGLSFLGQFFAPIVLAPIVAQGNILSAFYAAATTALLTGLLMAWQLSQPVKWSTR